MTTDELKKEAEKWLCNNLHSASEEDFIKAMVEFAEPREKRIADLEQENELLKTDLEFTAKTSNKNKQTVKEYSKLVDEYSSEGADLQDRIKEFEQENAELKEALKGKRCNCMTYFNFKDLEKQLTKAKEIIKELLCLFPDFQAKSLGDLHILNTLAKAEAFLNSEVEK